MINIANRNVIKAEIQAAMGQLRGQYPGCTLADWAVRAVRSRVDGAPRLSLIVTARTQSGDLVTWHAALA